MTEIKYSSGVTRKTRVPSLSELDFSLESIAKESVLSQGSTTEETVNDARLIVSSGNDTRFDAETIISPINGLVVPSFKSLTPEICTVDASGNATTLTAGTGEILVTVGTLSRKTQYGAAFTESPTSYKFVEHLDGSLASGIKSHIAPYVDAGGEVKVFNKEDFSNDDYERNEKLWVNGLDLSGVAAWNDNAGKGKKGPTAITENSGVCAKHYPLSVGDEVLFVANDNSVVRRTISASVNLSDPGLDLRIVKWDSALPSKIKKYKLMPGNWRNYLPTFPGAINPNNLPEITRMFEAFGNIPMVGVNQDRFALFFALKRYTNSLSYGVQSDNLPSNQQAIAKTVRVYDSGLPVFFPISGEGLVLAGHWVRVNGLPAYADFISEINSALSSLGDTNTIQTADLSGFTDFSA